MAERQWGSIREAFSIREVSSIREVLDTGKDIAWKPAALPCIAEWKFQIPYSAYKGGVPARPPRSVAPENSSLSTLHEFCDHPDRPEPFASARRSAAERNTVETVQWQTEMVQRGRREIDDTARRGDDAAR